MSNLNDWINEQNKARSLYAARQQEWAEAPYNRHLQDMSKQFIGNESFERYMFLQKEYEKAKNQYYNGQESPGSSELSENMDAYMPEEHRLAYRKYLESEYERFGHKGLNLSNVPQIEEQEGLSKLEKGEDIGSLLDPYFKADGNRDRSALLRTKREQLANLRQLENSIYQAKKDPVVMDYLSKKGMLDDWHEKRSGKLPSEDPYAFAKKKPSPTQKPKFAFEIEKTKMPVGVKKELNTKDLWGKNLTSAADATAVGMNLQNKIKKAPKGYTMWADGLVMPKEGDGMTPLAYNHMREYVKDKTGQSLPEIKFANEDIEEDEKLSRYKTYEKENRGNLIGRESYVSSLGAQIKKGRKRLQELEQEESVFKDGSRLKEINKYRQAYGSPKDDIYVKFNDYAEAKKMNKLITPTSDNLLKIGDVDAYENNYVNKLEDLISTIVAKSGSSPLMKDLGQRMTKEQDDLSWWGRHKNIIQAIPHALVGQFQTMGELLSAEEDNIDSVRKDIEYLKAQKLYSDFVDPQKLGLTDAKSFADFMNNSYDNVGVVGREWADKVASLGQIVPDWMQNTTKAVSPGYLYFPQEDVFVNGEGLKTHARRFAITGMFKDPVTFFANKHASDKDFKEMLLRRFQGDDAEIQKYLSSQDFLLEASAMVGGVAGSLTPAGPLGIGGRAAVGLANGARRWKRAADIIDKWEKSEKAFSLQQLEKIITTTENGRRTSALTSFFVPNGYQLAEMTTKTAIQFGVANILESIDEGTLNAEDVSKAYLKGGAFGFTGGILGQLGGKVASRAYAQIQTARNLGIQVKDLQMVAQASSALAQIPANIAQSLVGRVIDQGWKGVTTYTAREAALDVLVGAVFSINDLKQTIDANKSLKGSEYWRLIQDIINETSKRTAQEEAAEQIASQNTTPMDEAASTIVEIADAVQEELEKPPMFSGFSMEDAAVGPFGNGMEFVDSPKEAETGMEPYNDPVEEESSSPTSKISDRFAKTAGSVGMPETGNYGDRTDPGEPMLFQDFIKAIDEIKRDGVISKLHGLNEAINGRPLMVVIDSKRTIPQYSPKDNVIYIPDMDDTPENMVILGGTLREEVAHAVTIKRLRTNDEFAEKILEIWDEVHSLAGNKEFWMDAYNAHIRAMGYKAGEQITFDEYVETVANYYLSMKGGKPDLIEFIGGLFNRQAGIKEAMMNHRPKTLRKLFGTEKGSRVYNGLVSVVFNLRIGKPKSGKVVSDKTKKPKQPSGGGYEPPGGYSSEDEYEIFNQDPVVTEDSSVETSPKDPTLEGLEKKLIGVSENADIETTSNIPIDEGTKLETGTEYTEQMAQNELEDLVSKINPEELEYPNSEGYDVDLDDTNELFGASPNTILAKMTKKLGKETPLIESMSNELERVIKEEEARRLNEATQPIGSPKKTTDEKEFNTTAIPGKIPRIEYEQGRVLYTQVSEEGFNNKFTGSIEPVEGAEWASIKMAVAGDPSKIVYMHDVLKGQWYRYTPSPKKASFMHETAGGKLEKITNEQAINLVPAHGMGGKFERDRDKYLEGTSVEARGIYPPGHPNRTQDFYLSSKIFDGFREYEEGYKSSVFTGDGYIPIMEGGGGYSQPLNDVEADYAAAMAQIEFMAQRTVADAANVPYNGVEIKLPESAVAMVNIIQDVVAQDESLIVPSQGLVKIEDLLVKEATKDKISLGFDFRNGYNEGEILAHRSDAESFVYTDGQAMALLGAEKMLSQEGNQLFRVIGYAGTGKTTILENVNRFATAKGYKVVNLAPTGSAVQNIVSRNKQVKDKKGLSSLSAIEPMTVASFLGQTQEKYTGESYYQGVRKKLMEEKKPLLIVVDESSMLQSADFHELVKVLRANDKIIFMGDGFQNSAINPTSDIDGRSEDLVRPMDLNDSFFGDKNYVLLTEVMRVGKENTVVSVSNAMRLLKSPVIPEEETKHIKLYPAGDLYKEDRDKAIKEGRPIDQRSLGSDLYKNAQEEFVSNFIEDFQKDPSQALMVVRSNAEKVQMNKELFSILYPNQAMENIPENAKLVWLSNKLGIGIANGKVDFFNKNEFEIDRSQAFKIKQNTGGKESFATVYVGKVRKMVTDKTTGEEKLKDFPILFSPDWGEATLSFQSLVSRGSVALIGDQPKPYYDEGAHKLELFMAEKGLGGVFVRAQLGPDKKYKRNFYPESVVKEEETIPGFTYGLAMTGHKAQGGQAANVYVIVPEYATKYVHALEKIEQGAPVPANDAKQAIEFVRWMYTATTRTTDKVNILSNSLPTMPIEKINSIVTGANKIMRLQYSGKDLAAQDKEIAELLERAKKFGEQEVRFIAEETLRNTRNEIIGKLALISKIINSSGDPIKLEAQMFRALETAEEGVVLTPSERMDTALRILQKISKNKGLGYQFFQKDIEMARTFIEGRINEPIEQREPPEAQYLVEVGGFTNSVEMAAFLENLMVTNYPNFVSKAEEFFLPKLQQQRAPQETYNKISTYIRNYFFNNHNKINVPTAAARVYLGKQNNKVVVAKVDIMPSSDPHKTTPRPGLSQVAKSIVATAPSSLLQNPVSHGGGFLVAMMRKAIGEGFDGAKTGDNFLSLQKLSVVNENGNSQSNYNGLWTAETEYLVPEVVKALFKEGIYVLPKANGEKLALDFRDIFGPVRNHVSNYVMARDEQQRAENLVKIIKFTAEMTDEILWTVLSRPSTWKDVNELRTMFPSNVSKLAKYVSPTKIYNTIKTGGIIKGEDVLYPEHLTNENLLKQFETPELQGRLQAMRNKISQIYNWQGFPSQLPAPFRLAKPGITEREIYDVLQDTVYGYMSLVVDPSMNASFLRVKGKETEDGYSVVKAAKFANKYTGVTAGEYKVIKDNDALLNVLPKKYALFNSRDWAAHGVLERQDGTKFYRHAVNDFDGMLEMIEKSESLDEATKLQLMAVLYPFTVENNDGGTFVPIKNFAELDKDIYGMNALSQNKYGLIFKDSSGNILYNKTEGHLSLTSEKFSTPELQSFVEQYRTSNVAMVSPLSAFKTNGFMTPITYMMEDGTELILNEKRQVIGIGKGNGEITTSAKDIESFVLPYFVAQIQGKGVPPWTIIEVDMYGDNSRRYVSAFEGSGMSNVELGHLFLPANTPGTPYYKATSHLWDQVISNVQKKAAQASKAYADLLSENPNSLSEKELLNIGSFLMDMAKYYEHKQENPDQFVGISTALELPLIIRSVVDADGKFIPSKRDKLFLSGRMLFAEGLQSVGIREGAVPSDAARMVAQRNDEGWKVSIPMRQHALVPNIDSKGDLQRLLDIDAQEINRDVSTLSEAEYIYRQLIGDPSGVDLISMKESLKEEITKDYIKKAEATESFIDPLFNIWQDGALVISVGRADYADLLKEAKQRNPHTRTMLGAPIFMKSTPGDSLLAFTPVRIGGVLDAERGISSNKNLVLQLLGKDFDGDRLNTASPSEFFDSLETKDQFGENSLYNQLHRTLEEIGVGTSKFKDEREAEIIEAMSMISNGSSKANTMLQLPGGGHVRTKEIGNNPLGARYAERLMETTIGVGSAVQKVKKWTTALASIKRLPDGEHVLLSQKGRDKSGDTKISLLKQGDKVRISSISERTSIAFTIDTNPEYQQMVSGLYKQIGGVDSYGAHTIDTDDLWYGSKFVQLAKFDGSKWVEEAWTTLPDAYRNQYTTTLDKAIAALSSPKFETLGSESKEIVFNEGIRQNSEIHAHYWKHVAGLGPVRKPIEKNKKYAEIREKLQSASEKWLEKYPKVKPNLQAQIKTAFGGKDVVTDTPFSWFFDTYTEVSHRINYLNNPNLYIEEFVKSFDKDYAEGKLLLSSYATLWHYMFALSPQAKTPYKKGYNMLDKYGGNQYQYNENLTAIRVAAINKEIPLKEFLSEDTGMLNKDIWHSLLIRSEGDLDAAKKRAGMLVSYVFNDVGKMVGGIKSDSLTKSFLLGKTIGKASLALERIGRPADLYAGLYTMAPMPGLSPKGNSLSKYEGVLGLPMVTVKDKDGQKISNMTRISLDEVLKGIASNNIANVVTFTEDGSPVPLKTFIDNVLEDVPVDEDIHGASFSTFIKGAKNAKKIKADTPEEIAAKIRGLKDSGIDFADLNAMAQTAETALFKHLVHTTAEKDLQKQLHAQVVWDLGFAMARLQEKRKAGSLSNLMKIHSKLRRTDNESLANDIGKASYYPPNFPLAVSNQVLFKDNQMYSDMKVMMAGDKVNENTRQFSPGGVALVKATTLTPMIASVSKNLEFVQSIGHKNAEKIFYKAPKSKEMRELELGLKPEKDLPLIQANLMDAFTVGDIKFVAGQYDGRQGANIVMEIAGESFAFGDFGERMDKAIERSLKVYDKGSASLQNKDGYVAEIKRLVKVAHFRGLVGMALESTRTSLVNFASIRNLSDISKKRIKELDSTLGEEVLKLMKPSLQNALDATRVITEKNAMLDKLKDRLLLESSKGPEAQKRFLFALGAQIEGIEIDYDSVDSFQQLIWAKAGSNHVNSLSTHLKKRLDMSIWNGTQKANKAQQQPEYLYKVTEALGLSEHVEYDPVSYYEKLETQIKYIQATVEDIMLAEYMQSPEENIFAHTASVAAINKMSQNGHLYTSPVDFRSWGQNTPLPIRPGSQVKGFAINKKGTSDRYSGRFIRNVNNYALIYNENTQRLFAIKKEAIQNMFLAEKAIYTEGSREEEMIQIYENKLAQAGDQVEAMFLKYLARETHSQDKPAIKEAFAETFMDITSVVANNNKGVWEDLKQYSIFGLHWWNYGSGKFFAKGTALAASSLYFAASGQPEMAFYAASLAPAYMAMTWARNYVKSKLNSLTVGRAAMSEYGELGLRYSKDLPTDPTQDVATQEKTKEAQKNIKTLASNSMGIVLANNQYNAAAESDMPSQQVKLKDIPRTFNEFLEMRRNSKETGAIIEEMKEAQNMGADTVSKMITTLTLATGELIKNKGYKIVKVEGGFELLNADGSQPVAKDAVMAKLISLLSNTFGLTMLANSEIEAAERSTELNANMLLDKNPAIIESNTLAIENVLEALDTVAVGRYSNNVWNTGHLTRFLKMYENFSKEFRLASTGDVAKKIVAWNGLMDLLEENPSWRELMSRESIDLKGLRFANPIQVGGKILGWSLVAMSSSIMNNLLKMIGGATVGIAGAMLFVLIEDDFKKLGYTSGFSGVFHALLANVNIFAADNNKEFKENANEAYKTRKDLIDSNLGLGEKATVNIMNILLDAAIYKSAGITPGKQTTNKWETEARKSVSTIPYIGQTTDAVYEPFKLKVKE